jgi:WD40 repeat protein
MPTLSPNQVWYYVRDRKKVGPVPWHHLRELAAGGRLRPEDMVLADGTTRWAQAQSVAGLFSPLASFPANGATLGGSNITNAGPSIAVPMTTSWAPTLNPDETSQAKSAALPNVPGYKVFGELGRGGMGVVYKAEQIKLKRLVALKMVLGGVVAGPHQLERFRSEAEAVARLQHPGIVQIYEVGELDGLPFFSLEYCAGGSLAQRLDGTPLASRDAAALIETLARAVHAAHERDIVHRDLKPANVLLTGEGTPKITDFGLAKKMDETAMLTQSGAIVGTPSYMAPEQALGKSRDLGPAADIYALGTILYEMLTGRPPFKAASPMETMVQVASDEPAPPSRLQSKVPRDLETICLKCLEKSPRRRYPTAQSLADDLRRYLDGEPIQARPADWKERAWKWAWRRPAAAALIAVIALGLLVVLLGSAYFTIQLGRERNAALKQKAKAEKSEAEVKNQKETADNERNRAEEGEREARKQLEHAQRSLLTAQLWRVAGLLDRDPLQALQILEDEKACPKDLHDFAWGYHHALCRHWTPSFLDTGGSTSVAVTRDGKLLASSKNDGSIAIWDLETRKVRSTFRGHKSGVTHAAFNRDGTLLASASHDKTVKLWDVATGQTIATLTGHTGEVSGVAFSPDGKWVASGSQVLVNAKNSDLRYQDGEVRLWNVADRKQERVLFPKQSAGVTFVDFSPDGLTVAASMTHRSDVHLLETASGKILDHFSGGSGWVYRVAFSPDGKTLAWATAAQVVHLRDVPGRRTRLTLRGHQTDIFGLAWSPDGKTLATGDTGGTIKFWDPTTGRERLSVRDDRSRIAGMAFSPDGGTLFVAHDAGRIALWQLTPRRDWATFSCVSGFGAVALSPDDRTLVGCTREKTVKLWDLGSRKERTIQLGDGHGTSLAFAPKGDLFAVGIRACDASGNWPQEAGECQLWDPVADRRVATLKTQGRGIQAVAFMPDGQLLLTGDRDGKIRVWDVPGRRELGVLGDTGGEIFAIALSPDGRTLTSGGNGFIKLWDLAERRERTVLRGHLGLVRALTFLDDGQTLASGDTHRQIKLWDVHSGKLQTSLPDQPDAVLSLAVRDRGRTLAVGCQDRTVRLWDISSGQLRAVLPGHTREVNAVTFSSDGRILISASGANASWWVKGGEVMVWKADE